MSKFLVIFCWVVLFSLKTFSQQSKIIDGKYTHIGDTLTNFCVHVPEQCRDSKYMFNYFGYDYILSFDDFVEVYNGKDQIEYYRSIYLFKKNGGNNWNKVFNNQIHESVYWCSKKTNKFYVEDIFRTYNSVTGDELYSTIHHSLNSNIIFLIISVSGDKNKLEYYPIFLFILTDIVSGEINKIIKFEPKNKFNSKYSRFYTNHLEIQEGYDSEFRVIEKNSENINTENRSIDFKLVFSKEKYVFDVNADNSFNKLIITQ